MTSARSRILRREAFALFFSAVVAMFGHGIPPCTGFHVRPKGNFSGDAGRSPEKTLPNHYLDSTLDESRALEEVIYSDILNNLRNLMRDEDEGAARRKPSSREKDEAGAGGGKSERERECENRNETYSREFVHSSNSPFKNNVFLSGAEESVKKGGGESPQENFTPGGARENEYLLGYGGNPFGRPIAGVVEVAENEALEARGMTDPRKKRSVLHLYNMVLCTTGCNPFAYKGYGCYCGFLGSGFVVDGIDSCCKMHDWCYNSAGCPMFFEYFIPYLWKCYRRQPLCAIDHGNYGGPGSCAQRLCECDRQLALCLRRYPCPSTKALCTSSPWRLLQNILML